MATFTLADGTPIIWADATDWPDGGAHGLGNDNYQIDLTSLANGAARQGAKGDLGATRAPTYAVKVGVEFLNAPANTGAGYVEFYWSSSLSGTAATGNDGGTTGADAAYADPTEWTRQLTYIGSLIATADATPAVQIQTINEAFQPPTRYGMPVVVNRSAQEFEDDAVEMFIALIPTTPASA